MHNAKHNLMFQYMLRLDVAPKLNQFIFLTVTLFDLRGSRDCHHVSFSYKRYHTKNPRTWFINTSLLKRIALGLFHMVLSPECMTVLHQYHETIAHSNFVLAVLHICRKVDSVAKSA